MANGYNRADLIAELEHDEGVELRPYLDGTGHITVGVGWNLSDNGLPADALPHLQALFDSVTSSAPSGQIADAYHALLDSLLNHAIDVAEADLDTYISEWRTFSADRQRALVNMSFNLGGGTLRKFKKMIAAIRAGDWNLAADEALDSAWAQQVGQRAIRITDRMRGSTK